MNVSFKQLGTDDRASIEARLKVRKSRYLQLLEAEPGTIITTDFLLIGDKPGPSAPTDPNYHHTPFYSTKHCSGWLNAYLHVEDIPEEKLLWINAYDRNGNPTTSDILTRVDAKVVIALGANAYKWAVASGLNAHERLIKVPHPQWHKRFMNGQNYDLFDVIKCCCLVQENSEFPCAYIRCPMHNGAAACERTTISFTV